MSDQIVHSPDSLSCECSACTGGYNPDLVDATLDPSAGGIFAGKTIWTPEQAANYLNRTGGQYGNGPNDLLPKGGDPSVITFGFHENQQSLFDNGYVYARNGQLFAFSEYFQFGAFTEAQRAATREAMGYWDDVVAVTFRETHANDGDINFGNLTNSPNTQAYSRIPTASFGPGGAIANFYGNQIAGLAGDVWVSVSQASNFQFDEGLYGMNTLVHEIGHSLGLSHPGNYNFGPGFAVNYQNGAEYAQDIRNYTIMSYWNPRDVGIQDHDYNMGTIAYGATPMVHDILAAQKMYGADMTTRTGDTTYGFNATADTDGRDALNFDKTPAPVMAIWDAGGIDTLDASGYATNQIIDLTPGSLSSIGGVTLANAPSLEVVNANRLAAGYAPLSQASYDIRMNNLRNDPNAGRLVDNVGIAYGTTIENAKGGSGNDAIGGNSADNVLTGNAGNDALTGREGNDTLDGGLGDDIMLGGTGDDRYIVGEAGDVVTENADEGIDTVLSSIDYTLGDNVENLELTGTAVRGTGNSLDNRISGNGVTNLLTGGAGNDVFVAEINDVLTATKLGDLSVDILVDFDANGDDRIDLSGIDADLTQDGHQSFEFVGKSNGKTGEISYKTYGNMNAAEKALGFEIDGLENSQHSGPVTVIFGNNDADKDADFAFVVYGTPQIDVTDFIFG